MRFANTSIIGMKFFDSTVQAVWEKGNVLIGSDPRLWRQDQCGIPIRRDEYGNTDSPYGWEIDHIRPIAFGGGDELSNLQPLHWRNNRGKGDNYPIWSCAIGSR